MMAPVALANGYEIGTLRRFEAGKIAAASQGEQRVSID
jgi:hypothetical protein